MNDQGASGPTLVYGTPGGPCERSSQEVLSEIERYVSEALVRHAVTERATIRDDTIGIANVEASRRPLGGLQIEWCDLHEDEKRQRAAELARSLASPLKARPTQPPKARSNYGGIAAALAVLALGAFLWKTFGSLDDSAGEANGGTPHQLIGADPDGSGLDEQAARAARVCEATRARVVRGATVTVADADGWVVEIWAMKEGSGDPLHTHPALRQFVSDPGSPKGSDYIWADEPELTRVATSRDRVVVAPASLEGPETAVPGVRLTFEGALVDAYFRKEERRRYFHLASALAQQLEATHVGVYARCAEGDTHHVGTWFRGLNDGGAAAAVVYLMGMHARPVHLASPYLRLGPGEPVNHSVAFANIQTASEKLDRPVLATLLGREGGMVTGRGGEGVIITFPFRDANRASRFSRELTRLTSIGGL